MPSIIVCPSCSGQLRLPDELIGQEVRCPTCNNVFIAATAAPPVAAAPAPSSPPETRLEPRPPASNLGLDNGRESLAPDSRGLVGAVELKLSLDDDPPARAPARTPDPTPRPLPPPSERGRDDEREEDLRPCPSCGKRIHRDSTGCYNCGWSASGNGRPRWSRDSDRDRDRDRDRDWDRDRNGERGRRREPERRDREPSRGVMILVLGILSLLCITMMLTPVGMVLGLIAWVMGHGDLNRMKANEMDPDGSGLTQGGWICGMIGTGINTLLTLGCLSLFGVALLNNNSRPATTYKQPVQYKTKEKDIIIDDGFDKDPWNRDRPMRKDFAPQPPPFDKGVPKEKF